MTERLPTVFVVDDDASVRKGLLRLLKSAGYRPESCASAEEFLKRWERDPAPGCVLLDIQMPGLDGLQLQQKLQACAVSIPIIFITGHGDIPSSVSAMKAGAVDFLPKPIHDEDLLRAVREAIQQDRKERTERAERDAVAERFQSLTPREREVAVLIAEGLTNAELARRLYISPRTAAVHVSSILRKLGVSSRTDVAQAVRSESAPIG